MNKKIITKIAVALTFCAVFLSSCYAPNPLYGKWADNNGNTITFNPDYTYSAKIQASNDPQPVSYDGDYMCIENVITFSRADGTMNTEWDIRGSILYLTWTTSTSSPTVLTLYHVKK